MEESVSNQTANFPVNSTVEKIYLSKRRNDCRVQFQQPQERTKVIQVSDFPELGRLTALRFLEWVMRNPEGVISLPTGKTPEYFIKYCRYYLGNQKKADVRAVLSEHGIEISDARPLRTDGLYFVQMDEFFPVLPERSNSFSAYIRNFYIDGFSLNKDRASLMEITLPEHFPSSVKNIEQLFPEGPDLSLRYRKPMTHLESLQKDCLFYVDEFCEDYEQRIKNLGGIGFFLGGIGPDGHIAFNISGSSHESRTRLLDLNYETLAAASIDLGGMERARNISAITIGLKTITEKATAIIFAAGQARSHIIKESIIEKPNIRLPASALQKIDTTFYLTDGAAFELPGRNLIVPESYFEKISVNEIERKFSADFSPRRILHTAPHHDDIMLGYFPVVNQWKYSAEQHFAYATAGFNAVTNIFLQQQLQDLNDLLQADNDSSELSSTNTNTDNRNYNTEELQTIQLSDLNGADETGLYLAHVFNFDPYSKIRRKQARAIRLLRSIQKTYNLNQDSDIEQKIKELQTYCKESYPGKIDSSEIQKIKSDLREWEAELLWLHSGYRNVHHLRLQFYRGQIFSDLPAMARDVKPIVDLLLKIKPDTVTVALDPEGSGPDTHFKVLMAVSAALKKYRSITDQSPTVIGYRNIWYRFFPREADLIYPVSLFDMYALRSTFLNSFHSQKEASFPSYEYDGPFCDLSISIMQKQFQEIRNIIGDDFFRNHASISMRQAAGLVFLRKMDLDNFLDETKNLRKRIQPDSFTNSEID